MSAGSSGVPDTTKEKCPPDPPILGRITQNGGSPDCVRGNRCGASFVDVLEDREGTGSIRGAGLLDFEDRDSITNGFSKKPILKTNNSKILPPGDYQPPSYSSLFSSSVTSIKSTKTNHNVNTTSDLFDTQSSLFSIPTWPRPSSLPLSVVSSSSSSDEDFSTVGSSNSSNSSTDSLALTLDSPNAQSPLGQSQIFLANLFIDQLDFVSKEVEEFHDKNWFGITINDFRGGEKVLIVKPKDVETLELRESVLELFETADEDLGCEKVIIGLEKSCQDLGQIIHSLLYVGGQIIPPNQAFFTAKPDHVLIGLDI